MRPAPAPPDISDATGAKVGLPPLQPTDAALPKPRATPFGMGPGTLRLTPSSSEAALAYGRQADGVSAKINAVTMARSLPTKQSTAKIDPTAVQNTADTIRKAAEYGRHLIEQLCAFRAKPADQRPIFGRSWVGFNSIWLP